MTPGSPKIDHALDHCATHAAGEGISLSEALDHTGPNAFCFGAFLLAVPFVQPVPLGPLTMVCGATFIALGWQMATGQSRPRLPKQAGDLRIQGRFWLAMIGFSRRLLAFCRPFTRERLQDWVSGPGGQRRVGWLILTGGALLAIPVANLPLNNLLPALMIIFACLGWLERDGLMILVSLAWGALTIVYFTVLALALVFFGRQIFTWLGWA